MKQKAEDNRIGDRVKIIRYRYYTTTQLDGVIGTICAVTPGKPHLVDVRMKDGFVLCEPFAYINYSARGRRTHATFMKSHGRTDKGTFKNLGGWTQITKPTINVKLGYNYFGTSIKEQLTDKSKREKQIDLGEVKHTFNNKKESIDWEGMEKEIRDYIHQPFPINMTATELTYKVISIVKKYIPEKEMEGA